MKTSSRFSFAAFTAMAVAASLQSPATAADLTWSGGGANGNSGGANNWVGGAAPAINTSYDVVYSSAAYVGPQTTTNFNTTGIGFSSLTISDALRSYTLIGAGAALTGNVTVTSGTHTFNTALATVTSSTWNIAAGAVLNRSSGGNVFGLGVGQTLTKTGGGTLNLSAVLLGSSGGTIALQEGTLQLVTADNIIGSGTYAASGGTFEVRSNTARDHSSAAVVVSGDSTFTTSRAAAGAGSVHTMGNLSIGGNTVSVTSSSLLTSGTAGFAFGATALNGTATFHTVNNGAGALTSVALGAVSGAGGLTKSGDGELILTAANSYLGATSVNAGTLILNAGATISSSPSIAVAQGATLDASAAGLIIGSGQTLIGGGTILGTTIVEGNLAPGSSPGSLTFGSNLTLESTALLTLDITGTGPLQFDQLIGNDTLTLGGTLVLNNTGYIPTLNETITVFSGWSNINGSFSTIVGTDLGGGLSWDTSNLAIDGTITVVPEPSTAVCFGLAVLGFAVRARSRRRAA
jgi:fibronectin-binding autotransporter adhesin